jgi:hypothetical protein
MLAFVAVVKRSLNTKKVFIALIVCMNVRCQAIDANGLHKTSKGMREMNYQDTQQFERATMLELPIQPLLVLCGVSCCPFLLSFNWC